MGTVIIVLLILAAVGTVYGAVTNKFPWWGPVGLLVVVELIEHLHIGN
jgi:hypothetical protein